MITALRRTGSVLAAVLAAFTFAVFVMAVSPANAAPYKQIENRERPWFSGPVCLEIAEGSTADYGAGEVEWCSYNSIQQQWIAVPVPDVPGYYYLQNFHSGRCLEVTYGRHNDGAWTGQYSCSVHRPYQHWKFVIAGNTGFYEIVNRNSLKCLTNSGWRAIQYNCDGSDKQYWTRPF